MSLRSAPHKIVICGLGLLLAGLWLGTSALHGQTTAADADTGCIGIVATPGKDADGLTIGYVAEGSPAAVAGVVKGDCLIAIDDTPTRGMSAAEGKAMADGPIGSVVRLTVKRDEGSDKLTVSVIRRSKLDAYLPAAQLGDPSAQSILGYYYLRGPTAIRDPVKAAAWYGKSAAQGHAIGETDLAYCYLHGEGLPQSDKNAYSWFYTAAIQDDPVAQENLAFLYHNGRGVARDDRAAFAWYYRSAERGNFEGKSKLAYMYERGLGVAQNNVEALKWYQMALADRPDSEALKKAVAIMSLRAFLENPDTVNKFDLAPLMAAFRKQISVLFLAVTLVYIVGGAFLIHYTFKAPETPVKIPVALGWIVLYLESQGVAFLGLCLFDSSLDAGLLISVTSFFCALPVIVSSLGPARNRIWRESQTSLGMLAVYAVGAFFANGLFGHIYETVYVWLTHSPLPAQPTLALIGKTKGSSVWLACATIAILLPVAEEIIFRGYLFEALKQRLSGGVVVVLTAFAFSLIHFQAFYFIPLFGFGLIMGWIRLKTHSLRLTALLHVLNNGIFLFLAV